jgi:hypothetical protein
MLPCHRRQPAERQRPGFEINVTKIPARALIANSLRPCTSQGGTDGRHVASENFQTHWYELNHLDTRPGCTKLF